MITKLGIKKVFKSVLVKYLDFLDIFFKELAVELLKYLGINKYIIDLKKGNQLLYKLIYSLQLVELEILKTYIKTNLANGFI